MWSKIVCAVCGHSTVTENHLLRAPHCAKCGGPVRLHTASEADIAAAQGKTMSGVTVGKPISVDPQRGFTLAGMTVKPIGLANPSDPRAIGSRERAFELRQEAIGLLNEAAKLDHDALIVEQRADAESAAARAASAERDPVDLPMDVRAVVEASGGPEPTHFGAAEAEPRDPELPPGMP